MATDPELRVHRDWIGLLQPVGLVVSPPALLTARAFPDKNILKEQQALLALVTPPASSAPEPRGLLPPPPLPLHFEPLATEVLGWKANQLVGGPGGALPDSLEVVLPEFGDTLRATYAVRAPKEDDAEWLLLVQELPDGTPLDEPPPEETKQWHAAPEARLERLLRETGVPIGVLSNGRYLRLVYAPRGESSGHITWPVHRLCTVMDRDMLSALCMLLGSPRLFTLPTCQRLPHLLRESRSYQNVVSTQLAGQVLEALSELLRGFQSANEASHGQLLDATVSEDPNPVYGGLLAVLLRLVFVLYAEERGLVSSSATYVRSYSLVGLFEKLRIDAGRFPDTMDQRYGAWSRLLVLFRMVHDGARRGDLRLPPRYGHLFDPDGWAFLEGRPYRTRRVIGARVSVPKVPDGVVLRVLEKLLLLDGDRLSYRALDVEQIGSVYENMMGFRLQRATETSLGVGKQHVVVGLDSLLATKGAERSKRLKELAGVELSGKAADSLKAAETVDDLAAALGRRISPLTPRPVGAGDLYLQPTDERRRSGSHYTPRELTEPIVRTTLRPILEELGVNPKPEQILSLKICDPAMGSGAFLVETCRQLAEQLQKAYDVHGRPRDVPPDEHLFDYAQRRVAQSCLYGVDKNPFAVDLGKLSLWLATLARGHAFTFLDHSIRHGDSLVGLTREQIASFHWAPERQIPAIRQVVANAIQRALSLRRQIQALADSDDVDAKRRLLLETDAALSQVRTVADGAVASFFSEDKAKARDVARAAWETKVQNWLGGRGDDSELQGLVGRLRTGERAVPCFHWEVEFPEVYARERPGFDGIVGNPPFLGGKRISTALGHNFTEWLTQRFQGATGNADLVAYFFRAAFALLRQRGAFGLIATKTIAEGDTRTAGLRWLLEHGATVYAANRRRPWPGKATVIVSTVAVRKGSSPGPVWLNGQRVQRITAFLFHRGQDTDPHRFGGANTRSYIGCFLRGMGFTFDDSTQEATPTAELWRLRQLRPDLSEVVRPYLGGEEVLYSPAHRPHRYAINLAGMTETEARRRWPELMSLLERKVRPSRARLGNSAIDRVHRERWWLFANDRPELRRACQGLTRLIAVPRVSSHLCAVFLPSTYILSDQLVVFAFDAYEVFSILQSRPHEAWARCFSSTMGAQLRYAPSDCFETFPLPEGGETGSLGAVGNAYYDFRAALMIRNNEGLSKTYHRFHEPDERDPDILKLRELHAAMDRAVLDAYGWTDLQPTCEFFLDCEQAENDNEDNAVAGKRRKKKPWRYRWPDEIRDEVLARLLELNAERAKREAEVRAQATVVAAPQARPKRAKAKKSSPEGQGNLF